MQYAAINKVMPTPIISESNNAVFAVALNIFSVTNFAHAILMLT